ncbi:hypothetical protein [Nonomuraea salmonea]|uniref:hypothetical protein n=1 Tax=Nonomuraea salmonea TaxID=46181 RepID=UPI0031E510A2
MNGRRLTHAVLDRMGTRAAVRVSGGKVSFTSPTTVGRAVLDDLVYRDGRLSRVIRAEMDRLPPAFTAQYRSAKNKQTLSTATAKGASGPASLLFYDRAAGQTVIKAELSALPAKVRVVNDLAAHRVTHTSSAPHPRSRPGAAARRRRDLHPARQPRHDDQGRCRRRRVGAAVGAARVRRHVRGHAARPPRRHVGRRALRGRRQHRPDPCGPARTVQHARHRGRHPRPRRPQGGLPGRGRHRHAAGRVREPQVGAHRGRHRARRARRRAGVVGARRALDGQGGELRQGAVRTDLCQ